MDMADTIWTALGIMMVVCVCVDSGLTVFSGIQAFQLAEDMLYICVPKWAVWSTLFALNLPLEIMCVFSTKRYPIARAMMAVHVVLKLFVMLHLGRENALFWATHYLNQGIIVVLLVSSVRSFFTTRSSHAKQSSRTGRSAAKTTSTSSYPRQLAFVRGLY